VTPDGTRVLSAESAQAMRTPQVAVPDVYTLGSHWGLGWILMTWDGREVYGHDGGTLGQSAFMRIIPDAGVAVCLLTNGGHTQDLFRDLFNEILGELVGIQLPERPVPAAESVTVDLAPFVGRYAREGVELTIAAHDDHLVGNMKTTSALAEAMGAQEQPPIEIRPVDGADLFVGRLPGEESWTPFVFFTLDGRQYLHMGARATPKVG
jgi:hypothetical protein